MILCDRFDELSHSYTGKEHVNRNLYNACASIGDVVDVMSVYDFKWNNRKIATQLDEKNIITNQKLNVFFSIGYHLLLGRNEKRKYKLFWKNLENLIEGKRYDVVVCSMYGSDLPMLLSIELKNKKKANKIAFWEHRTQYHPLKKNLIRENLRWKLIRPFYLSKADYLTAISKPLALLMSRLPFLCAKTITVIPNPVSKIFKAGQNDSDSDRNSENFKFVATQNFTRPQKGLPLLLDAMKLIALKDEKIKLEIWGTVDQNAEAAIKSLSNVSYNGKIKQTEIPEVIANCDAAIIASTVETFSNPAAEALCMGKPVLTTCCGGPESFVRDGKNGLIVNEINSSVLAQKMLELVVINTFDRRTISEFAWRKFGSENWKNYWKFILVKT